MAHQNPFFVGDFGLTINLTVADSKGKGIDISAATATEYEIEDPKRNIATVTASFVNTGADGKLTYLLQSGDLDEGGVWKVRVKITEGGTKCYRTEKLEFPVEA